MGRSTGLLRNNIYTLTAKAGDSFLMRLLKTDATTLFRPRIDIYDNAGTQLLFLNTNDLARVNFTVPADGTYSLVVTDSFDNSQCGSFTLLPAAPRTSPANAGTLSLRRARRRAVSRVRSPAASTPTLRRRRILQRAHAAE